MTLVDTSAWIRFLANRDPFAAELGGVGSFLPQFPVANQREIVGFVQQYKLHGRGIGWINAHLLYSAIVNDVALWTADQRLARVAQEAGVAYLPRLS